MRLPTMSERDIRWVDTGPATAGVMVLAEQTDRYTPREYQHITGNQV